MIKQGHLLSLLRSKKGATAIEFAIIAPILILFLFVIIQFAMVLYGQYVLESGTSIAARELKTGAVNQTNVGKCALPAGVTTPQSQQAYITCLIEYTISPLLVDPTKLSVTATVLNDFSGVSAPTFSQCSTSANACQSTVPTPLPAGCNTSLSQACVFGSPTYAPGQGSAGGSGQVVEFAVSYAWPIIVPYLGNMIGSGANPSTGAYGTYLLTAAAVVQNEPDDTFAVVQTLSNCTGTGCDVSNPSAPGP